MKLRPTFPFLSYSPEGTVERWSRMPPPQYFEGSIIITFLGLFNNSLL